MRKIWITYAWADNQDRQVDFIAQELGRAGLEVKLDRWNLSAGGRLWDQLDRFISDPIKTDAWLMYVTPNSLGSEPCREEVAYALDRALRQRGANFPIIGLFQGAENVALFPASLRTRLCVNLEDADWKERIVAASEGREVNLAALSFDPYVFRDYPPDPLDGHLLFEMRPRAGVWSQFAVGVLKEEVELFLWLNVGAPNVPVPHGAVSHYNNTGTGQLNGTVELVIRSLPSHVSPGVSGYAAFSKMPTAIWFGSQMGAPVYSVVRRAPPALQWGTTQTPIARWKS